MFPTCQCVGKQECAQELRIHPYQKTQSHSVQGPFYRLGLNFSSLNIALLLWVTVLIYAVYLDLLLTHFSTLFIWLLLIFKHANNPYRKIVVHFQVYKNICQLYSNLRVMALSTWLLPKYTFKKIRLFVPYVLESGSWKEGLSLHFSQKDSAAGSARSSPVVRAQPWYPPSSRNCPHAALSQDLFYLHFLQHNLAI